MGGTSEPAFKIGEYWLAQRKGSPVWYRFWYDTGSKSTRRASLGTSDFEEAKVRLSEWIVLNKTPEEGAPGSVLLSDVIRIYYEEHGQHIASHESARLNLTFWLEFFPPETTVEDAARPQQIDKFIADLRSKGDRSNAYINRILMTGRAAINRAWKQGILTTAPFIKSLPVEAAGPMGRPMEMEELRLFYHTAPSDHLKAFILWALGTAARPQAVLDLHSGRIDVERELIELNPIGRTQTKKHRPTVKLPPVLKDHVKEGFQVSFRDKPVMEIKTAWRNQRKICGFDDQVQPYSMRHTMARHLRASGVPAWEVAAQLGHKKREMSITEIYAPFDPSYLAQAVVAIDNFLRELLIPPSERPLMSWPIRGQSSSGHSAKSLNSLERAMRSITQ
ncbi:MAG: tyrosine-type recombinase/integrase [Pseudomonadota bacterium]